MLFDFFLHNNDDCLGQQFIKIIPVMPIRLYKSQVLLQVELHPRETNRKTVMSRLIQ